jgi:ABC-type spermidine/putrescine transport system permease subunit I
MLLMYAWPFVASVARSFVDQDGRFGFGNYTKTAQLYLKDLAFTFSVTVVNTLIAAAGAILLAVYFRLRQNAVSRLMASLLKLPIFIPFVVVAQMMNSFLAPHGLLNTALAQIGLINLERPLQLFNFSGLSFGFSWKQIPFALLIIHGGFQMIDNSYIEAARSAGASLAKVVLRIVSTFTLPYMLIGGKVPTTITVDIAHRVGYFRDFGVANALGVCSYVLVMITAVYYLRTKLREAR